MLCLGPIISFICLSRPPVDWKLALAFAIAKPMELHVHGFEPFGLNVIFDDTFSRAIVRLQRCARLWMAHSGKYLSDIRGLASVDVERAKFTLGCT